MWSGVQSVMRMSVGLMAVLLAGLAAAPAHAVTLFAQIANITHDDSQPLQSRFLQTSLPGETVKAYGSPAPFNWVQTAVPRNTFTIMVQGTMSGVIQFEDAFAGDIDLTTTVSGGTIRVTSIEFFADAFFGDSFVEQVNFVDSADKILTSGQPFTYSYDSNDFNKGGDNGFWSMFIIVDWLNGQPGDTIDFDIPNNSIDLTYVPAGSEQFPPGDLNEDCIVNIVDLNIVLGNFGLTTSSGDANGDGQVDILDLNVVLGNFNAVCPGS